MPHAEYFNTTDYEREAIDSSALGGLEMAFEANRELDIHGPTQRFQILLNMACLVIGRTSIGEYSPHITDPSLAYLPGVSPYHQ